MANSIPTAKITLSYPLYSCAFDPIDPNQLIVAGGGGPGRNGVGNKITVLDTSKPDELSEVAELELSPNEDNVTTLATGPRKDRNLTLFAGVNSSPEDIKKGKNEHFRVFSISQPAKSAKTSGVRVSEVARDALFLHKDASAYQRLLRLSHPYENLAQLGAIATGLSKESEIALFDVPCAGGGRWKSRGRLDIPREAMDLDVVQTGPDTYQLAYCDDHEIFTVEVSKTEISDPKCVYTITPDEGATAKASFKSLRYLTPGFLITVVNRPNSNGVALHGYRLPAKEQENARLAIRARLPKGVSKATGLAVRNLSPASSPSDKQGETQFVVAVAGNDASISLFTLEHKSAATVELLADLAPFHVLKGAHPSNITGITFSPFTPPKSSKPTTELTVKLATVGVGFTTVVHSIPLKKHIDKSVSERKGGPPRPSRYVVALKSQGESPLTIITLLTIVVLFLAMIGQTFLEAKDIGQPILGIKPYLPTSWTKPLRKVSETHDKNIQDLLSGVQGQDGQPIVIRHAETGEIDAHGLPPLHVGVHSEEDEETHGPTVAWESLDRKEQDVWKLRLKKTGHWVEDMGESIFKGVLFGEIGGAIGNIVGEAL
ncbi:uncharacterized protein GGS22DRAFT_166917 [Annulohypoxylon maeteangense]|uniref:uncharacterized protein n=1 Tax=Annulohypoxylon maeteangense TaxID=1927788 RepID=UPI00200809F3|nr:uncharacterized protein GGS22DRAFT_166917 [Annulohypoxylon maeteangense]KAI0883414.1 hypothetical protein GGS22DRAFT_166917 [Annulohypoxylon maeteangense]